MSAGKGSAPRSCFSKEYKQNYDAIFRKVKGGKVKGEKAGERNTSTQPARTLPPHP
jgi:hypothetical protein